ncbi:MAG TPA: hypothetical protein ENI05_04000 [Porticoccus sp.]|nr:hypothetical protein [Porticoccus sp.]
MALGKAEVLAFVNAALLTSLTQDEVNPAIKATLTDLAKYNLLTAAPVEIVALSGAKTIDYPTLFKRLVTIQPNDGSNDRNPLIALPGGYKEYLRKTEGLQVSSTPGQMWFAEYNKKFFIYPTLSQDITFTVDYYQHSARDVDNIAFGDEFANAVNFGSTYHAALFRKKTSYVDIWLPIYLAERATMIAMNPPQPSIVGR